MQLKPRFGSDVAFAIGAMRVTLGLYLLVYYAVLSPHFAYYFEPGGMIEPSLLSSPKLSLVLWLWNSTASRVLLAALIVCAALFTIGWHARRVLVPLYVLHLSFHHANPLIIHEPQQLTNLLLLLSIFLPIGCAFTVHGKDYEKRRKPTRTDEAIVTALVAYLGAYYFLAGAKKLTDPLWRSGISLWNLIQWPPFAKGGPVAELLIRMPALAKLGAYGALLFEMTFLPLAFSRLRPLLLPLGALFHLGIYLTLEVGSFSYVLVPWYALMLDGPTRKAFATWYGTVRKYAHVDLRRARA